MLATALRLTYGVVLIIFVWQTVLVRQLSETWPPEGGGAQQLFLPAYRLL